MIGVILAAGISSRLRPLTDTLPKSLLPVGGKPLLQRALESLLGSGVERCVIVTGYRQEMIEQFVTTLKLPLHVTFLFNEVFRTTNNNYSLWLAGSVVEEDMLLLDADILFDRHILTRLLASHHADAVVVRNTGELGDEEIKVQLDGGGRILRIGKDVPPLLAAGESLGIEKFSLATARQLFSVLEGRRDRNEFYEASFQEIIDDGAQLFAVDTAGYPCMEVDTPEDLAVADALSLSLSS